MDSIRNKNWLQRIPTELNRIKADKTPIKLNALTGLVLFEKRNELNGFNPNFFLRMKHPFMAGLLLAESLKNTVFLI